MIWDFNITFDNLIFFFRKNVFQPYERTRRLGHKNQSSRSLTLTLDLKKKILKGNVNRMLQNRGTNQAIFGPFLDI